MKYVCEPFSTQITGLEEERKELQQQLATAVGEEKASITAKIAEIDREVSGLQQGAADCLSHQQHFKDDPKNPRDPRK